MPDSRAKDILARQAELEHERAEYEAVWEKVAEFCDPDAPDQFRNRGVSGAGSQPERSERRGARIYDNTINSAAVFPFELIASPSPAAFTIRDWINRCLSKFRPYGTPACRLSRSR